MDEKFYGLPLPLVTTIISGAVAIVAGGLGALLGYHLSKAKEDTARKLSFIETQLKDLYGPVTAEITYALFIDSYGKGRVGALEEWIDATIREDQERDTSLLTSTFLLPAIDQQTAAWSEKVLPAIKRVEEIVRQNFHLTTPRTRSKYKDLVSFIQNYESLDRPPNGVESHGLQVFLAHSLATFEILQEALSSGDPSEVRNNV